MSTITFGMASEPNVRITMINNTAMDGDKGLTPNSDRNKHVKVARDRIIEDIGKQDAPLLFPIN